MMIGTMVVTEPDVEHEAKAAVTATQQLIDALFDLRSPQSVRGESKLASRVFSVGSDQPLVASTIQRSLCSTILP